MCYCAYAVINQRIYSFSLLLKFFLHINLYIFCNVCSHYDNPWHRDMILLPKKGAVTIYPPCYAVIVAGNPNTPHFSSNERVLCSCKTRKNTAIRSVSLHASCSFDIFNIPNKQTNKQDADENVENL